MTRFDAPEYVTAWQQQGEFPAIHEPIFRAVTAAFPDPVPLVDLGASTGLLTRRLTDAGYPVLAIERPGAALASGVHAGTYDHAVVRAHTVHPKRLDRLGDFLRDWRDANGAEPVLVARRVLPEIRDAVGLAGWPAFREVVGAYCAAVVLEGRQVSSRTTHPLGSADAEVADLAPTYYEIDRDGPVRVLRRVRR